MTRENRMLHVWLTKELFAQLIIFSGVLSVYLWSMPRTVVLEDDGLFLLTAYFNGIAHPPGYPLYTLLSHIATWVPFGSIAARVHGFTAVLGALCCVCMYQVVRQLLPGIYYALVASFSFGFSLAFWSQSIIAEVYSLNVLIILLLLRLSMLYADSGDTGRRQRLLIWMGILYGLGLSNHWPLLVLSTPLFLAVLLPYWRDVLRQLPRGILFGLLGLTPYLWMIWRSQMDPLISFYGPINDWQEFWFHVSRKMYSAVENSPTAGWYDKLMFSRYVVTETARQFTSAGMVLVIVGFLSQWQQWRWPVATGLTLGYAGNTFILIGLLGLDYDYYNQSNFRVCLLVAYAICGIWLALGLKVFIEWIFNRWIHVVRLKLLQGVTGFLVVALPLMANTADNFRARDTWAEDYSRIILASLDKNAVLFTYGDTDVWTIGYVHHVSGVRPDISLFSSKGNVYSNRLYKQTVPVNAIQKILKEYVLSIDAPVYYTNTFAADFGQINFGLYKQINKYTDKDSRQAVMLPGIRQYIETLLIRGEPVDNWEKMHYRMLMAEYCHLSLILLESSDDKPANQDLKTWVDRVCDTYNGYLMYAESLLADESPDLEKITYLLQKADALKFQNVLKAESAKYFYLRAELNINRGQIGEAIDDLEEAYRSWSHPDNPALKRKQELEKPGQSYIN